ncbi:hypothetical protein [Bradyrhizobium sp. UFLA05-112]
MDPATVAQAIASIIAKINEYNERSAARAWQSEVTSKLDLIIYQNGQIIGIAPAKAALRGVMEIEDIGV